MLAGKPSPSLLHPASSRVFPTRLSVFPLQGVQEDQPQRQGESMQAETGPCARCLGAGQPEVWAVPAWRGYGAPLGPLCPWNGPWAGLPFPLKSD